MKISDDLMRRIASDIGLTTIHQKGQSVPVKNCWHFMTDGNAVDALFQDKEDFIDGMNRVYTVVTHYDVVIFAFCLMDTHVHFVLYGDFDECRRFMHEYVRRTSYSISRKHSERNKLDSVPINFQAIDSDEYLKTCICYVVKNPPVGGLPYTAFDYPWSSGPLYFRAQDLWTSPKWRTADGVQTMVCAPDLSIRKQRMVLKSRSMPEENIRIIDGMVFPGDYVAYHLVEMLFRTTKSYNYFLCRTRESDVEQHGGVLSQLSIPIQEMRQHKSEVCVELFGVASAYSLDIRQRILLARTLKSRFNSSPKQIARLCGLNYEEVSSLL